jgi:hypothetical protein
LTGGEYAQNGGTVIAADVRADAAEEQGDQRTW